MTYVYLLETPDYVYCGQHRCANNKDPMADYYKGSGSAWTRYIKDNGWWKIESFRSNVKKTILEIVLDDSNRQVIGNVEKFWISWARETYGDRCLNITKGSRPNVKYVTYEDSKKARKSSSDAYEESHRDKRKSYRDTHKEEYKAYYEAHREELNANSRAYYKANVEQAKSRFRTYSLKHKEEIATYKKIWSGTHKEEVRDYKKDYYLANKDKILARQNSPEKKRSSKVGLWARRCCFPDPSSASFPSRWTEEDKQEYQRQYNNHNR